MLGWQLLALTSTCTRSASTRGLLPTVRPMTAGGRVASPTPAGSRRLRKHEAPPRCKLTIHKMLNSYVFVAVRAVTNPPRPLASRQGGAPLRCANKGAVCLIIHSLSCRCVKGRYTLPLDTHETSQHPPISQNLYNFAKLSAEYFSTYSA